MTAALTNTANKAFADAWNAPMSNRYTLNLATMSLSGVEHGVLALLDVSNVPGVGEIFTIHESGRSYWAGRGDRAYAGATIRTFLVRRRDDKTTLFRALELSNVPATSSSDDRFSTGERLVATRLGLVS